MHKSAAIAKLGCVSAKLGSLNKTCCRKKIRATKNQVPLMLASFITLESSFKFIDTPAQAFVHLCTMYIIKHLLRSGGGPGAVAEWSKALL